MRDAMIVVAEASAKIGRALVEQLQADRYRAALAHTAEHARSLARSQPVRAIVLGELGAPCDSLGLLEEIRRRGRPADREATGADTTGGRAMGSVWDERLPVLMLDPRGGQLELQRAFDQGADDFVVQVDPEHVDLYYVELRARLRAVLRRTEGPAVKRLLRAGELEIDTESRLVRISGVPIELCRLEYELLVHLAHNPTGVCAKRDLLGAVWKQRCNTSMRTVDSHASRLRRKLERAGAPGLVVNVRGVGYRLI